MLVDDTTSRIALIVWAVTWLPTLALASARVARNDGSVVGDARRFLEAVAALAVPMVAFGLYAWGATERYAAVHGRFDGIGVARSVAAVAVPHAVSVLALSFAARRARRRATPPPSWVFGLLCGLGSIPLLVPALFLAQVMVFFGG